MTESYIPPSHMPPAGLRELRASGPSVPVRLEVPAIGISTTVVPVGLRADGGLDLPPGLGDAPAAWFRDSSIPGERGASLIAGHAVTTDGAPAVFYRLRLLRPGDRVEVRRADHVTARFGVVGVGVYPAAALPADHTFGPPDEATLTLITVGGAQDRSLVVSARLLPEE